MRVFTIKTTRKNVFTFIMLCVAVFAAAVAVFSSLSAKSVSAPNAQLKASTESERIAFLAKYGWKVKDEVAAVKEVVIPQNFSDVYENYNKIQLQQGFDLTKYKGKAVKQWSYTITNYPGYENTEYIMADILVLDGQVIGGDVCSVELDGFMHGFKAEK